ncbi:hypothetical protein WJ99_00275 [Burkholderia ubonensis]|nr:hypothetical protein WJ29_11085 [Burkholderia ubonensis]KVQ11395.1 hypothetical protein WJ99_00275 [Burkholderia ubonensis]KVR47536.1 hypothetical protein WK18_11780 [Burkholderia ubonensis]KVT24384.1 hypothetical protein WK48_21180 [Burkholderia ubonensis]KVU33421.1 hypothetical protein WK64_14290 [Burkholderia ubonensis]
MPNLCPPPPEKAHSFVNHRSDNFLILRLQKCNDIFTPTVIRQERRRRDRQFSISELTYNERFLISTMSERESLFPTF